MIKVCDQMSGPYMCAGCGGGFHASQNTPGVVIRFSGGTYTICPTCAEAKLSHAAESHERYLDGSMP